MHMGFDPQGFIQEADLAIVIEADVPYIPGEQQPKPDCKFATIGEDPVFARYPMRSFPSDLAITATGQADYGIVIPNNLTLVGFTFYAQVFVLYLPTGVAVSNGLMGVVGY